MNPLPNTTKFLDSHLRNTWYMERNFLIYARKSSRRAVNGRLVDCFDIAAIENKADKGKNAFWNFLDDLKVLLPSYNIEYIYIESIHNVRLYNSLIKRGFFPEKNTDSLNVFIPVKKESVL